MNYTCDKCGVWRHEKGFVRAYSEAKRAFVYICLACAKTPDGYHLTTYGKRRMGVKLDKRYSGMKPMK